MSTTDAITRKVRSTLDEHAQAAVAERLQPLLVDLELVLLFLALTLDATAQLRGVELLGLERFLGHHELLGLQLVLQRFELLDHRLQASLRLTRLPLELFLSLLAAVHGRQDLLRVDESDFPVFGGGAGPEAQSQGDADE